MGWRTVRIARVENAEERRHLAAGVVRGRGGAQGGQTQVHPPHLQHSANLTRFEDVGLPGGSLIRGCTQF